MPSLADICVENKEPIKLLTCGWFAFSGSDKVVLGHDGLGSIFSRDRKTRSAGKILKTYITPPTAIAIEMNTTLPKEIWRTIFSLLSCNDLKSVIFVGSAWNNIANANTVWKVCK